MSKQDASTYYERAMEDGCGYYEHSDNLNDDLAFYDGVLKMGIIAVDITVGAFAAGVILNCKNKKMII